MLSLYLNKVKNLHFVHNYNCSIYLPIEMVHKVNDEIDTLYHHHHTHTHTHSTTLEAKAKILSEIFLYLNSN